jgi:hypothetical protein
VSQIVANVSEEPIGTILSAEEAVYPENGSKMFLRIVRVYLPGYIAYTRRQ